MPHAKQHLINSLIRAVGNTGHMRTIEQMLERLEIKPEEREAVNWLARELEHNLHRIIRAEQKARRGF